MKLLIIFNFFTILYISRYSVIYISLLRSLFIYIKNAPFEGTAIVCNTFTTFPFGYPQVVNLQTNEFYFRICHLSGSSQGAWDLFK